MKVCLALFSYGGVQGGTIDALIKEIAYMCSKGIEVSFIRVKDDALVSRSRSVVASRFLEETNANVLFMLDHDIDWQIGDIFATCEVAYSRQSLVGGIYSCRAFGYGISSRFVKPQQVTLRTQETISTPYLAAGFLAIPRTCLLKMIQSQHVQQFLIGEQGPYYDFFMPMIKNKEYLSEDWAFSSRANDAGVESLSYAYPFLRHYGQYGFMLPDAEKPRTRSE